MDHRLAIVMGWMLAAFTAALALPAQARAQDLPAQTDVAAHVHAKATPAGPPRLQLGAGFPTPRTLDAAALQALPRRSVTAQDHGATGTWDGVAMADVLAAGGVDFDALRGKRLADYLVVTARDGYRVVFALADFAPAFGAKDALLADTRDGAPLADQEGPLRIILPGERKWGRWIRQVETIELRSAAGDAPAH